MITERDLLKAIKECQGQKNPNSNTCIKLASYYTILNNIQKDNEQVTQSFAIEYTSDTEFMKSAKNADQYKLWQLLDELVSTVEILTPNVYRGFMRKLNEF